MQREYRVVLIDGQYAIHEASCDEDGTIIGCSPDPSVPRASSLEELKQEIERYGKALEAPAIDLAALKSCTEGNGAAAGTAVGVFEDRRHAHIAVDELCRNGFTAEQIGFAMPEERPVIDPPHLDHHTRTGEGAKVGAAAGGTVGGLVGAAIASAFIPGLGPVLAGGMLAGTVAGLASGSLLGALLGMSVPEEDAKVYEQQLHSGQTLVTVSAGDRYKEAMDILRRAAEAPEVEPHLHHGRAHLPGGDMEPGSGKVFFSE